jgi:hypothetical protein
MIKINKVIALGLLLAPGALRAGEADAVHRFARGVVFQASRFVAGALAVKGVRQLSSKSVLDVLESKFSPTAKTRLQNLQYLPQFAQFAAAGLAPQALNRLTDSFLPGALVWLAPSEKLSKEQADKAGRFAFWAGMAMSPLVDTAVNRLKSFKIS